VSRGGVPSTLKFDYSLTTLDKTGKIVVYPEDERGGPGTYVIGVSTMMVMMMMMMMMMVVRMMMIPSFLLGVCAWPPWPVQRVHGAVDDDDTAPTIMTMMMMMMMMIRMMMMPSLFRCTRPAAVAVSACARRCRATRAVTTSSSRQTPPPTSTGYTPGEAGGAKWREQE
jgi:hypothetical protein